MAKSKAVAKNQRSMKELSELLNKMEDRIGAVATRHLTPERIIKIALSAASRQPRIAECTTESLLNALMDASQIGLEPGGPAQHAALIPRRNRKTGKMEAHFEAMYQGYRELILRGGQYRDMEARAVYERDKFSYQLGLHPDLVHVPYSGEDRGPLTHVYSIAWPTDGGNPSFDVMARPEVEAIRQRSQSKDDGPWVTDYDEMAKKTVVKRHRKILRLDSTTAGVVQQAVELEGDGDVSVGRILDPSAFDDLEDGTVDDGDQPTKADQLAEEAKKKAAPKRKRKKKEPETIEAEVEDDSDQEEEDEEDEEQPEPEEEPGEDVPAEEKKAAAGSDGLDGKIEQLQSLREKAQGYESIDLDVQAQEDIADVIENRDEEGLELWIKHLSRQVLKAAAAEE